MAVGMKRAVDSAIGLPRSSTSASRMLVFLMPPEVRRSLKSASLRRWVRTSHVLRYPSGLETVTSPRTHRCERSLFEQAGFSYVRPNGKNHTVMRTTVKGARYSGARSARSPPARDVEVVATGGSYVARSDAPASLANTCAAACERARGVGRFEHAPFDRALSRLCP